MAYRYGIFISYVRAPSMGPWVINHFRPKLEQRLNDLANPAVNVFCDVNMGDGVNLTALPPGPNTKAANPIAAQGKEVLAAVSARASLVSQWRNLSKQAHAKDADPKLKDDLAALTKKVEDADAKIREAAKPKSLHFEVVPSK